MKAGDFNDQSWSSEAEQAIDPLMQEAINWLSKLSDGQADEATLTAHQNWLAISAEHELAYSEAVRMWGNLAHLNLLQQHQKKTVKLTRRRFGQLALFAVLGGGAAFSFMKVNDYDYVTAAGEVRLIVLPDGSQIQMAGETAVSVQFTPEMRQITLHYGEAYFTVARHALQFVVEAAEARITALGTQFNVRLLKEQVIVMVTEHMVRVDYARHSATIIEGEKLHYAANIINLPEKADSETELAWRSGKLIFLSRPFSEVLQELNRWSPERLRLLDGRLANRPVTLIVNISDIGDIVPQLLQALPISTHYVPFLGTMIYSS
ncbi:transmembrane sensor [Paenochrobactrum gallinarii]|uniref:Transmembrane sensor n=1 Tax=Paenochrobactrum gallinarii TaxID=643673 RepID=A0A841LVQ7_9HYPH|nr:FecR domain-containing protein [Paenochrobactrum gallinarii]MBB6260960.1 transmembrane sensor [Paenochrobactrum gallinarii]